MFNIEKKYSRSGLKERRYLSLQKYRPSTRRATFDEQNPAYK